MANEDSHIVASNFENLSLAADLSEENNGDDLTKPFDFADVTFIVENKPIYYNRGFLAMHSPHFKRLFYGANANHDKEIRLKDRKFNNILIMLKLLKLDPDSSEQLVGDSNVEDLLKLAEEYQLRQVTAECEKFLLLKWKFSKSKIVKALQLSAKFGLYTAIKDLLVKPREDYPALLTDDNIEEFLPIAKEYQLANILDLCEKYLLLNWKQSVKIVRAVELSAKFGLEKALANLLKATNGMQSNITDDNIEQLLSLCKEYSLFEIRADCVAYIMKNWSGKTEKALRAVQISHEMKLPSLAKAFIPLAACRPLAEIDRSMNELSTELFCAIVHAAFVRVGEGFDCTPKPIYDRIGHCSYCGTGGITASTTNSGYCARCRTSKIITYEYSSSSNQVVYPTHSCGKVKLGNGVSCTNSVRYGTCTCTDTAPSVDAVVAEMLKRDSSKEFSYDADNRAVPVRFVFRDRDAASVSISGCFRGWSEPIPLQRDRSTPSADTWHVYIPLAPGRYEFKFVKNNTVWLCSDDCEKCPSGIAGVQNNVIVVQQRMLDEPC